MKKVLIGLLALGSVPVFAETPYEAVKRGFANAKAARALDENLYYGQCYDSKGATTKLNWGLSVRNYSNIPYDFSIVSRAIMHIVPNDFETLSSLGKRYWDIEEGSWINTNKVNGSIDPLQVRNGELTGGLCYSENGGQTEVGCWSYQIRGEQDGTLFVKSNDGETYCYFDRKVLPLNP